MQVIILLFVAITVNLTGMIYHQERYHKTITLCAGLW